ncbi:MAG: SRP54-type protein GTPase domain [Blastocatellia bacterium]|nr:SRP54-type protein GTPase domain [Blastocatellia bacterium]
MREALESVKRDIGEDAIVLDTKQIRSGGLFGYGSTHLDDSMVSASKFGLYGASCLVITKLDETARPGSIAGIISASGLPLTYLGTRQRVLRGQ